MKKRILAILIVCATAAVIGGCDKKTENETNKYDELNAMLAHSYSQIVLTVTNEFDEDSVLTSEYTMKFSDAGMTITYSVERFSGISLDSAASFKTTLTGEAVIADGKVTYVQGDEVSLDAVTASTGLNFKEEYFENAEFTQTSFLADVKDASAFLGTEITCTGMRLNAAYGEAFNTLTVTYKAESGHSVEYLYQFGALA